MTIANQSTVIVIPDTNKADCDAALACWFGDEIGTTEYSVPLSSSGEAPATHWAVHFWNPPDKAAALAAWPSGVLPTPVGSWADYGLDATSALAAGQASTVHVMAASDATFNTMPQTNFEAAIAAHGLVRIS